MAKSILSIFLFIGMTMSSTAVFPILADAAGGSGWIQLAAQGKDRKAAADLAEFNGTLSSKTDPAFKNMLVETAAALEQGMSIAPNDAKITLFRGIDLIKDQLSDYNYGSNRRPFFAARLFRGGERNGTLRTTGLRKISEIGVFEASSRHAQNAYKFQNTPFISTSFSFDVAAASSAVLVLRVAPQRVLVAASTRGEYEVQLPFFIHPSEIVGVLEKVDYEEAGSRELSEYKLTKIYNDLEGMSDREAQNQIQSWARENQRILKPLGSRNDFGIPFDDLVRKKLKNPLVKVLREESPTRAEIEAMVKDMNLLRSNFRKALKGYQGQVDRNWGTKFINGLIPYGKTDIKIQEFLVDLANDRKFDSLPYDWSDTALEALRVIYKGDRTALRVLRRSEAIIPNPPFGVNKSCKMLF
ncbi:MAG: hypothetical protein AB7F59_02345 [Bdellovibrionales bacterium]